jgi:hypothetical protein
MMRLSYYYHVVLLISVVAWSEIGHFRVKNGNYSYHRPYRQCKNDQRKGTRLLRPVQPRCMFDRELDELCTSSTIGGKKQEHNQASSDRRRVCLQRLSMEWSTKVMALIAVTEHTRAPGTQTGHLHGEYS